jgi:spermidine/putrescine transport system substrate-binding protein
VDVAWDPGRKFTVPWQWGSTGIAVNTSVYSGDINTSAVFLEVPDELKGKINVVPEMNDVVNLAIFYYGGEPCTEDVEVLKKVRDGLMAAKPNWISMDYGATEKLSNNDWAASVNWNGSTMRARLANPSVAYGYPKEGYPLFMDSVALLKDAQNVDNAYKFLDFILVPENAAMISAFARYANGVAGSDAFMPEDMKTAPEVVTPAEHKAAGKFLPTCSPKATEYMTAIWTELQK